jgi:hypothetical protein
MVTLDEAKAKYGDVVNGAWPDEAKWCSSLVIANDLAQNWINSATGAPTHKIYCNTDLQTALVSALQNVKDRGLLPLLKSFDGCLNVRPIRGQPENLSVHAFALAIDINAATNPLGVVGDMPAHLVQCFKDEGFIWGGDFQRKDGMHFQYLASW